MCAFAFVASGVLAIEAVDYEGSPLAALVFFFFLPGFLAIGAIGTAILGLPLTLLLHRVRLEGVGAYVGAGFAIGTLIAKLVFTSEFRDTLGFYFVWGGVPAAFWGLTWRLTARRPVPDA